MPNKNVSLDLRLKKIAETRNYLSKEIKHNKLRSEKHKKACKARNYFEHFPVFISAITGCVSFSAFTSLVGVPVVGIVVGLRICAITAGIKKDKY